MAEQILGMILPARQAPQTAALALRHMTPPIILPNAGAARPGFSDSAADTPLRMTAILAPLPGSEPPTGPRPTFKVNVLEAAALQRLAPPPIAAVITQSTPVARADLPQSADATQVPTTTGNHTWASPQFTAPALDLKK